LTKYRVYTILSIFQQKQQTPKHKITVQKFNKSSSIKQNHKGFNMLKNENQVQTKEKLSKYPSVKDLYPLTTADVAHIMGKSTQTIWNWVDSGKIPSHMIICPGGQYQFKHEVIDHLLSRYQCKAASNNQ